MQKVTIYAFSHKLLYDLHSSEKVGFFSLFEFGSFNFPIGLVRDERFEVDHMRQLRNQYM